MIKNLAEYLGKFKTDAEVQAMTDKEYEDYVEDMIEAEQFMQEEGYLYISDYDYVVTMVLDYLKQGHKNIDQYAMEMLNEVELPLELTLHVVKQAMMLLQEGA